MRRWIFAALVLVNVALLIWGVYYVETERAELPEPPPQIAPEKMKPLPKNGTARNRAPARPAPVEVKPVVVPVAAASGCYVMGPITDVAHAERVEQGLADLPHYRRQETTHVLVGYRVYLPPFASREEAERKRRELTKLGFKDHSLLQDEGLHNALSLGLFSVEENAQARLNVLAEKGVQAQMQKVEQDRAIYWIELARNDATIAAQPRLKGLLEGIVGADVREQPCAASAQ